MCAITLFSLEDLNNGIMIKSYMIMLLCTVHSFCKSMDTYLECYVKPHAIPTTYSIANVEEKGLDIIILLY